MKTREELVERATELLNIAVKLRPNEVACPKCGAVEQNQQYGNTCIATTSHDMPVMKTRVEIVEESERLLALLKGHADGSVVCPECNTVMDAEDVNDYGKICPCDNDE